MSAQTPIALSDSRSAAVAVVGAIDGLVIDALTGERGYDREAIVVTLRELFGSAPARKLSRWRSPGVSEPTNADLCAKFGTLCDSGDSLTGPRRGNVLIRQDQGGAAAHSTVEQGMATRGH